MCVEEPQISPKLSSLPRALRTPGIIMLQPSYYMILFLLFLVSPSATLLLDPPASARFGACQMVRDAVCAFPPIFNEDSPPRLIFSNSCSN